MNQIEFIGIAGSGKTTSTKFLLDKFKENKNKIIYINKFLFESRSQILRYLLAANLLFFGLLLDISSIFSSFMTLLKIKTNIKISLNYLLQLSVLIILKKFSKLIHIYDQGIVQAVISLLASNENKMDKKDIKKLLIPNYLPSVLIKTYSPDEINFLRIKKRKDKRKSRMFRSEVDGKYWKNYLKAINRMEMILQEENILIYNLDSNCSLKELNLRTDFIFNSLKNYFN
tara:strand:- start:761 stop:1447 length:687 start_codon:yes stop_codon:yes gene_type:complete